MYSLLRINPERYLLAPLAFRQQANSEQRTANVYRLLPSETPSPYHHHFVIAFIFNYTLLNFTQIHLKLFNIYYVHIGINIVKISSIKLLMLDAINRGHCMLVLLLQETSAGSLIVKQTRT